jgi:hypothetical protein
MRFILPHPETVAIWLLIVFVAAVAGGVSGLLVSAAVC